MLYVERSRDYSQADVIYYSNNRLDENLMEIVYKHPLYLREQSKRILRTALFNDTLFLSNLNVMDYSLVVGVDNDKHELVVGIVDYIRTFTW